MPIKNSVFLRKIRVILATFESVVSGQGERTMREKERRLARRRLDEEMKPFRRASREKKPTEGLLRAVRQALNVPIAEITEKMGINRSVVFDMEASEVKCTINLNSMVRMAEAMECDVVYGIVPKGGKTLDALAERRLWESVLGVMTGTRE
jgi:predicted DNA-binding mobile mystery protein A